MPVATPAQIATAARNAGWQGTDLQIAVAVGLAESDGRTDATNRNTNGSTDHGVWQINSIHKEILASGNWRDLQSNANMAYKIWLDAGRSFRPWSVYKSGRFMTRMATARSAVLEIGADTPGKPLPPLQQTGSGGLEGIAQFVKLITDPRTYFRLAMMSTGVILIMIALVRMGWQNAPQSVKSIVKTTAKVAVTKGKVK